MKKENFFYTPLKAGTIFLIIAGIINFIVIATSSEYVYFNISLLTGAFIFGFIITTIIKFIATNLNKLDEKIKEK